MLQRTAAEGGSGEERAAARSTPAPAADGPARGVAERHRLPRGRGIDHRPTARATGTLGRPGGRPDPLARLEGRRGAWSSAEGGLTQSCPERHQRRHLPWPTRARCGEVIPAQRADRRRGESWRLTTAAGGAARARAHCARGSTHPPPGRVSRAVLPGAARRPARPGASAVYCIPIVLPVPLDLLRSRKRPTMYSTGSPSDHTMAAGMNKSASMSPNDRQT